MDKKELQTQIDKGCTLRQLADCFEVSQSTIRHWLKKYNLKTKNKPYNNAGRYEFRPCKCGEANPDNFYKKKGHRYWHLCKKCYKEAYGKKRLDRLKRIRKESIAYKGEECIRCGYSKCIAALEFHHRDPAEKDPNWKRMRVSSLDRMKEELDKCDLLCSNCHKEVHYMEGEWMLRLD